MKKLLISSLLALSSLSANAADYVIDTKGAHAFINFKIQHLGYSWLYGRFNDFSGEFSYDQGNPGASAINVNINTQSLDSNHAERDKHLRSSDFLNTDKFPTATFKSSRIEAMSDGTMKVFGDLTLHGVTKSVVIDAEKIGEGSDPWGGYRAGFSGTTTIALKDFDINYNLGPASANVELGLHIEGIRQ